MGERIERTLALMMTASGVKFPCTSFALSCKNCNPLPSWVNPFCTSTSSSTPSSSSSPPPETPPPLRVRPPDAAAASEAAMAWRREEETGSVAKTRVERVSSSGSAISRMQGWRSREREEAW